MQGVRKLLAVLAVLLACLPAYGNGWHTRIEWRGWRILSNEYLYAGRKHTSYPLTYLVDGDPRTAWVFSGNENSVKAAKFYDPGPYYQWIEISGNGVIDGIWIMNGYNRSAELFRRNNRVTQVKVVIDDKPVKTVNLSDKMGWHKISVPRQRIHRLRLVFTGVRRGRDDDTCISELALYNGKRKIDLRLPKMVLFSPGAECGCDGTFSVISRSGKTVFAWGRESPHSWSPSQKLLAGIDVLKKDGVWVWVADLTEGRTIYHKPVPTRSKDDYVEFDGLAWKGEDSLQVTITHFTGVKPEPSTYDNFLVTYSKTITLNPAK